MPTITIVPARRSSQRALLDGAPGADRDEDVVGAAPAGERGDRGDGVLGAGLTVCVAPKRAGRRELGVREVDRDDRARTAQWTAPWTAFSPTPPVPITTTRRARLGTWAVLTTAPKPGDHAAGEQRGAVERQRPRGSPTTCEAWTTTSLGERARCAAPGRSGWPSASCSGPASSSANVASQSDRLALQRTNAQAPQERISVTTTWSPAATPATPGADLDDDARRLVAVHRRQRAAPGALEVVDVALADRAGGEPDPHLAAIGCCELHLLDHERFAERAADGGSHRPEDTVEPDRCRTSVRPGSALDESGCDLS